MEEFRDLKAKLEARTSEQADKDVRTLELESSVKSLTLELQNLKKENMKLNFANKEALERNKARQSCNENSFNICGVAL